MSAQLTNRSRLAGTSFFLFCLALFLSTYSAKHPAVSQSGSALVSYVLRPFQSMNHGFNRTLSSLWEDYFALVGVQAENQGLRVRLEKLEAENSRLLEIENENTRLRGLLGVVKDSGFVTIVSNVIGYDASNWVQAITVDKGSADGIEVGMPVIEVNGVVGQVIGVNRNSARVLLITDASSGVDSLVQGNRVRGVVGGAGIGRCELRFVLRDDEVQVGDRLVTSGMDGVYPKGLLIGIVSAVDRSSSRLFQAIPVKPAVEFSRLENVAIITNAAKINTKE
jgi:rod shape-determining protein MreC